MEPGRFARLNTIVIDPGHGGEDTGARGPTGLKEKDVTLKVARTLKKLLQRGLGSQVFLTREDDSNLSLEQRAGIANGLKADLFITIHAGASPERSMRGVQIFLPYASPADLSPTRHSQQSHPGHPEEEVIEWETIHLKYLPLSRVLGRLTQLNLSRVTKREVTMRELPLLTLKGIDMPSFELELGYITNLSSETELKRDTYRDRIAEAVYRGIKQYKETLLLMGNPQ